MDIDHSVLAVSTNDGKADKITSVPRVAETEVVLYIKSLKHLGTGIHVKNAYRIYRMLCLSVASLSNLAT